jgi:hypothetical protein
MKSFPASFSLSVFLVAGSLLSAAEPAEQERLFIQGLRTRGYSRLALEYLKNLEKAPPADLAPVLPLEIARTEISLAQESPLDQRTALYDSALKRLKKFEQEQAARPEVVQAKMDIARLVSLEGKVHLSKALRATGGDRGREAKRARDEYFTPARDRITKAMELLDAQMVKLKGSKNDSDIELLETLNRERLQAQFEQAISVLLQAQTYHLSDDAEARGKLAREALKLLNEVSKSDDKNPLCYKAMAWRIPCLLTGDEHTDVLTAYKEMQLLTMNEYTLDAKLLADYFHLSLIPLDLKLSKNILANTKKECQDWLKAKNLALFGNTPGGYGIKVPIREGVDCFVPSTALEVKHAVRYELAEVLVGEAVALKKKNPKLPRVKELFREAQKMLAPLQNTESDLSRKAEHLSLGIFIALRGKKTDLNELTTFKELYFQSRYEIQEFYQAKKEADRKEHLANVALALRRALEVADARVPPRDLLKAGIELTDVYLNLGDLHRTALLGEYLARNNPPDAETARAAAYALEAYVKIFRANQIRAERYRGKGVLSDEVLQAIGQGDQDRFTRLADFVANQPAWKEEPVAQYARYQQAVAALRDNQYPQAIDLLKKIQPSWEGYHVARCQLALALVRLTEDDPPTVVSDAEKEKYQQEAVEVLSHLPDLPAGANPFTLQFHFVARLKQCKMLYRQKKYKELEAFADQMLTRFDQAVSQAKDPKAQLDEKIRTDLRLGLETWKNYARVGLADKLYSEGKYDEVLAITDPVVARVRKQIQDKDPIKDFQLVRDMLELGLRANVQKKKRPEARQIMEMLQRIATDSTLTEGLTGIKPTEILVRLVFQLRAQVQELRQKGKPAEAELRETITSFTLFMDDLTKDLDQLVKQLDGMARGTEKKSIRQQVLGLMARSYASLDQHAKAARLLDRIPEPRDKEGKPLSGEAVRDYLDIRLVYAQELRLARDFKKAGKILSDVKAKLKDSKSLTLLILTNQAEAAEAQLLEDQGKYREALAIWNRMIGRDSRLRSLLADRNFESLLAKYKEKADQNRMASVLARMYKDVQKIWFDCWYHRSYCMYQHGRQKNDERWIKAAANVIVKLETAPRPKGEDEPEGWKHTKGQFRELLKAEKPLRDMYEKLKATP